MADFTGVLTFAIKDADPSRVHVSLVSSTTTLRTPTSLDVRLLPTEALALFVKVVGTSIPSTSLAWVINTSHVVAKTPTGIRIAARFPARRQRQTHIMWDPVDMRIPPHWWIVEYQDRPRTMLAHRLLVEIDPPTDVLATRLAAWPWCNVYADGHICWGRNAEPTLASPDALDFAFFNGIVNNDIPNSIVQGSLRARWDAGDWSIPPGPYSNTLTLRAMLEDGEVGAHLRRGAAPVPDSLGVLGLGERLRVADDTTTGIYYTGTVLGDGVTRIPYRANNT